MPIVIAGIATSMGDTVTHDSSTPGGHTAQQHASNATTLGKIAQGGWDFVTIQCQSQEPSFSQAQVLAQTYPYVKFLDSAIQANSNCAETLYYMTWGRINGDLQNYPNDTYNAMQQRLRNGYMMFADSTNSSISPVGPAWKVMRDNYPNINLYNPDGSHPSANGTYLAACVFYCSLFKKSCVGSMYLPAGVGNADALTMQQVASDLVLDSIELWRQFGKLPAADYVYTVPSSIFSISFLNTSKRYASSRWHFGDGSPVDLSNSPNHTFPDGGPYTVCLEAISDCGKIDSFCESVIAGPLSASFYSATDKITLQQVGPTISIHNELRNCSVKIMNTNGQCVLKQSLPINSTTLSLQRFAKGIYFVQIKQNSKLLKIQKLPNF